MFSLQTHPECKIQVTTVTTVDSDIKIDHLKSPDDLIDVFFEALKNVKHR